MKQNLSRIFAQSFWDSPAIFDVILFKTYKKCQSSEIEPIPHYDIIDIGIGKFTDTIFPPKNKPIYRYDKSFEHYVRQELNDFKFGTHSTSPPP
jgi:hypothetical protein